MGLLGSLALGPHFTAGDRGGRAGEARACEAAALSGANFLEIRKGKQDRIRKIYHDPAPLRPHPNLTQIHKITMAPTTRSTPELEALHKEVAADRAKLQQEIQMTQWQRDPTWTH